MEIDARAAYLAVTAHGEARGPAGEGRCKRCGTALVAGYAHLHCPDCFMYMAIAGQPPADPGAPQPPEAARLAAIDAVKAHFAWGRTRLAPSASGRRCAVCGRDLPPQDAYPWPVCADDLAAGAVAPR